MQSIAASRILIEPCKWHSFAWCRNADGRGRLFLDDMIESAAVLECPNMHNDFQAFIKLDIYRHPEIATDYWLYLNDLTIIIQKM